MEVTASITAIQTYLKQNLQDCQVEFRGIDTTEQDFLVLLVDGLELAVRMQVERTFAEQPPEVITERLQQWQIVKHIQELRFGQLVLGQEGFYTHG